MSGNFVQSIRLHNFKRFESFHLAARAANILVGPNNCGKSSILDALRICQSCLRFTRTKSPTPIELPGKGIVFGYNLPISSLPVPIANITTNFNERDAVIQVKCENLNELVIKLHPERQVVFYIEGKVDRVRSSSGFRAAVPLDVIIVPPLGPLEEVEGVVQEETIRRNESNRLANRYFRNIWLKKGNGEWKEFSDLVSSSWPGVEIRFPEMVQAQRSFVQMFYREGRGEREVYWSGFGFQVWLQMLTHIMRGTANSILVLDEPDIYLHPDLQRKLLKMVRARFGQFFLATHSVEIINEGDGGEVVSVDSRNRVGKRVLSDEDYQALFSYIGSVENIDFARLGRARRIIFFEGKDKKILRKFAQKLGALDFVNDVDTLILQSGGFGQWRRVKEVAWTFKDVLHLNVDIFALFDRDYRSEEEIEAFVNMMSDQGINTRILARKEIENYALSREVIRRAIFARQSKRAGEKKWMSIRQIDRLLDAVSGQYRADTSAQIVTQRTKYFQEKRSRIDSSTIWKETALVFDQKWRNLDVRLEILPGKDFIAQLSSRLQKRKGFSLTINMLIDEMHVDDVPQDLASIICELNEFCKRGS